MRVCSWLRAEPSAVRRLYATEEAHWRDVLHWDTGQQWREVEQARRSGALPGLMAVGDDGRIRGWAYYLPEDGVLQLGGLVADTPEVTEGLLAGLLAGGDAGEADAVSGFVAERAAGLATAFGRRGFEVDPFHYLTLDLAETPGPVHAPPGGTLALGRWRTDAVPAVGALFRSAYSRRIGRYFAPHDRPDEWTRYATNLVAQPGCGQFRPDLSLLAGESQAPGGVLLMTSLDARTAHVAQLAVGPAWRRQQVARTMVAEAVRRARAAGFRRITLLVADANGPARALYAGMGFVARAGFVAAFRGSVRPVRLAG